MPVQGSTVARRRLARQLREMRERAGKTIADVHEAKICSSSTVVRIYRELEGSCRALSVWHPGLVHGLFQTDAYARIAVALDGSPAEVISERLHVRADRKLAAFGRPGRRVTVVLGAGALMLDAGSREVMEEQHRHLCDLSESPDVDIRVLSWSIGAHPAIRGGFTVLDLDDPAGRSVVFTEPHAGDHHLEDDTELRTYRRLMSSLVSKSVPVKEFRW